MWRLKPGLCLAWSSMRGSSSQHSGWPGPPCEDSSQDPARPDPPYEEAQATLCLAWSSMRGGSSQHSARPDPPHEEAQATLCLAWSSMRGGSSQHSGWPGPLCEEAQVNTLAGLIQHANAQPGQDDCHATNHTPTLWPAGPTALPGLSCHSSGSAPPSLALAGPTSRFPPPCLFLLRE